MNKLINRALVNTKTKIISSQFYQKNFLILREFRHIWKSFFAGVSFSIAASLFEAASIALLLSYVRDLSNQSLEVSQTGIRIIDELLLGH